MYGPQTVNHPEGDPAYRLAARVILLDPDDRVLLAQWELEDRSWWAMPGGGLTPGETHEDAAKRELAEETGLLEVSLGPMVWRREHVYQWKGVTYRQRELFFMCRVHSFDVQSTGLLAPEELGHRWWSVNEIREATTDEFAPRRLAHFLAKLLDEGPPLRPIDVGV